MANSRSAQRPATLWPCSRTSTPLQPAASLSSLQTGCWRSNSPAAEASLWPGAESNCRHADFQSAALPTELPGRAMQQNNLAGSWGRRQWERRLTQKGAAGDQSATPLASASETGATITPPYLSLLRWCVEIQIESAPGERGWFSR